MKGRFLLFLFFISGQIFSQYYYLPSTTQGNPGGLNTDNEYPSGSGLDASWEVLLGGSNSTPVWSPIDTIPLLLILMAPQFLHLKFLLLEY